MPPRETHPRPVRRYACLLLTLFHITTMAGLAQSTIFVDDDALANGNGSPQAPFSNIPAAVAYANTMSGHAPTIHVKPGRYEISDTIRIERSLTLQGENELELDSLGWPTGNLLVPSNETRIFGRAALLARPMIVAGKDGQVIRDVKVRGFTIEDDSEQGHILDFARVQEFEVRDNIFMGPGLLPGGNHAGVQSFASSGMIRNNYFTRLLVAASIGAGYPGSPGEVTFRGNRSVQNRIGLFLLGTSDGIAEPGDQLYVLVHDNDISENNNQRASAGIRFFIKGREDIGPGYFSTGLSTGNIQATIRNNRIVGNKVGIVIDGGFVSRRLPPPPANVCDPRTFIGSLDLTLRENTLADSALISAVITFTQLQRALDTLEGIPINFAQSQFLHLTTYRIDDPDNALEGRFTDHRTFDPFVGGTCILDTTHEPLNNTLEINGSLVEPAP